MRHLPPCVFSHHLPTCKTFVFVIVLSACVWGLWYDNKSCKNRCSLLIVQFLPSLSQSQESAALCCCYCVCSSVHEPLGLTDTAQSDILRLTPLITEVYMQIHDADSKNKFSSAEKTTKGSQKSAVITFILKSWMWRTKEVSEMFCWGFFSLCMWGSLSWVIISRYTPVLTNVQRLFLLEKCSLNIQKHIRGRNTPFDLQRTRVVCVVSTSCDINLAI